MSELTRVLNLLPEGGGYRAEEPSVLLIYNELRALARQKMARESPEHTLQPTALVHEAWLRLVVPSRTPWRNRIEFFSAAGEAMRRILVDHARHKQSLKRGGGIQPEQLTEGSLIVAAPAEELLAIDEALDELARQDPPVAELVKLRYYVGMTMAEAASAMDLTVRTAERLWTFARVWLRHRIREEALSNSSSHDA